LLLSLRTCGQRVSVVQAQRLALPEELQRSLACTIIIENMNGTIW
jgi:hypothetical protein